MEFKFLVIGKTIENYLKEGESYYDQKINHYVKFTQESLPNVKKSKDQNIKKLKISEGSNILSKIKPSDIVILLEEKGKQYDSIGFSIFLQKQLNKGVKRIVFIVGGAYGFCESVYNRANYLISLSPMTFSHQMARLIFKEQLYRGLSILKNEPYHHQ